MGNPIIMLQRNGERRYFEWSTITDTTNTYGMTLTELCRYIRDKYGWSGMDDFRGRMQRVHACGTSSMVDRSAAEVIAGNRCGEWGECKDQYPGRPMDADDDDPEFFVRGVCWTEDEIWDYFVTRHEVGEFDKDDDGILKGESQ